MTTSGWFCSTCFYFCPSGRSFGTVVRRLLLGGLISYVSMGSVWALTETADPGHLTFRSTLESWNPSEGGRVGVLGLSLFTAIEPNFKLGLSTYGAVTGQQGGLMTVGFAADFDQPIHSDWRLQAGLFIGGGGGAAGYTLTGRGLMLRANAGLSYVSDGWGNWGFGVSWVSFPGGQIRSVQPYLMYEYPFNSSLRPGWSKVTTNGSRHVNGFERSDLRQEISLAATGVRVPSNVINGRGTAQGDFQMAGARWTSYVNDRWFLSLQADGSATGSTSGYMQVLGGVGYRVPLNPMAGLKLYGLAGYGGAGGGAVDTGGGGLVGGGVALQQMLTRHWGIEFGVGGIKAPTGNFKAWTLGVNLTYAFDTPVPSHNASVRANVTDYPITPLQLRVMNQTMFGQGSSWRVKDNRATVNNLGLALDYPLGSRLYATGQGMVAYSGNAQVDTPNTAALELTGLLGLGWRQPLGAALFLVGEGLLGGSAGGTMNTGNGAVWQVNAGLGYQLTPNLSLLVTGGWIQGFNGQFKATTLGVNVGYRFDFPNR